MTGTIQQRHSQLTFPELSPCRVPITSRNRIVQAGSARPGRDAGTASTRLNCSSRRVILVATGRQLHRGLRPAASASQLSSARRDRGEASVPTLSDPPQALPRTWSRTHLRTVVRPRKAIRVARGLKRRLCSPLSTLAWGGHHEKLQSAKSIPAETLRWRLCRRVSTDRSPAMAISRVRHRVHQHHARDCIRMAEQFCERLSPAG
jgi:hypothetical protein